MSEVMGTPEPATPTPQPAAPPPQHVTTSPEEDMLRGAANLVDQNAPWKKGARWEVVLIQGVVLGVAGLIVWLAPGFGAAAILQLVALLLLVSAGLSVWRLLRHRVAPARVGTVAFRAGVGLSIGIVTILGSLIVDDRDVGTRAVAVVLGVGLVLYGLAALTTIVFGRQKGAGLPIVSIVVVVLTVVVGILLIVNGRDGIDALQGTFVLLGILIALAGLGLIGYALMLRQGQAPADTSDI
ncbi:MAG: hypothetical protein KF809_10470 [Chloroflexi bacterium]|nr:hypothetical protein [Chloroflexota bacterium]